MITGVLTHKSTLILIESEYFSFCQKLQYFWAFSRFKADLGSPRDRPFLCLCGFQKALVKTGFVGMLGRFVGFMGKFVGLLRGSLDYRGSSLDLHPRAKSWLVNTAIVRAVFSAVLSKRLF